MDFGEVLTRAWNITWKHKILWLFGILASCGRSAGNFGGGGGNGQPSVQYQVGPNEIPLPPGIQRIFDAIQQVLDRLSPGQIALIVLAVFAVGLFLTAVFVVLSTIGKVGLVKGALMAETSTTPITFGNVFQATKPFFWRMLGLNLLVAAVFLVLGFLVAGFVAVVTIFTLGIGLLCLLPLLCLLIPLSWLLAIVIEQAQIALVVEDLDVIAAIQRGLEVVRENVGEMILMGLVLVLGVGLLAGWLIALPVIFIIVPVVVGFISQNQNAIGGGLALALTCLVLYFPVYLALQGMLKTFIESSWTLTFLRLTQPLPPHPPEAGPLPQPA